MKWKDIFKSESRQREVNELLHKLNTLLEKHYPVEANYAFGKFMDELSKISPLEEDK
jgi:hypothetical protein